MSRAVPKRTIYGHLELAPTPVQFSHGEFARLRTKKVMYWNSMTLDSQLSSLLFYSSFLNVFIYRLLIQ